MADKIAVQELKKLEIELFTCNSKIGVCAKCYGMKLSYRQRN